VAVERDELGWDLEDKKRLQAANYAASRDFDTAVRALSGGALAVSIAFVHQIAHNPGHTWLLGLSWTLFAASLACNLISFLTGERVSRRMLHEMADPETIEIEEGKVTDRLNWASLFSFIGGLISLVLFALLNI
jgi:hypothetical protein